MQSTYRPSIQDSSPKALLSSYAFYLALLGFLAWFLYLISLAGFTLPIPWGDEALFVWQARALEKAYAVIAPEIDANRPILHQPFTYPAILALSFRSFGDGLEVARGVSLAFTLGGFLLIAAVVKQRSIPLISIILVGLYLTNSSVVAMANVARMEALLFFVVCLAMLLLQRQKVWISIAVLSIAPMIHPNGIFFFVTVAAYGVLARKVHKEQPPTAALVVFALSAALWMANAALALSHWDAFVYDLSHRVGESLTNTRGLPQLVRLFTGIAFIVSIGLIGRSLGHERLGVLLVIALGAWIASNIRQEQWYAPISQLAYLLCTLALLEMLSSIVRSLNWPGWLQVASTTLAAVSFIALHIRLGNIEGPRNYFSDFGTNGMHLTRSTPYFAESDLIALRDFVRSTSAGRPIVAEVHPWGDSILLRGIEELGARIQITYLDALHHGPQKWAWGYKATEYPTPDLYLFHISKYQPQNIADRTKRIMAHAVKTSGAGEPKVVLSRNGTETWYAISSKPSLDTTKR